MSSEANEGVDTGNAASTDNQECSENNTTPEKGRVWRWGNNNVGIRKNTDGPVLRATVKPVKRFISNISSTGTASTSQGITQQATQVSTKPSQSNADDQGSIEAKSKRQPANITQVPHPCNKKKRVREQWSVEDKDHFFEAVSVHGKDFEAIQKTIAQKHKKRGDETVIKTKDQVRHLYYRTWTTVSKLLANEASSNHIAKGTQELYAVINYGELRKKLGGYLLKKKGIIKLNELINIGSTTVRIKGKNYRIKTPSCKALKRMHDKEDAIKKSSVMETRRIKLPLRVNLEMYPLSMCAWNHVQLLAHNPRIRFSVPLDCQLSYLLIYLSKKWRSLSNKMFQVANDGYLHDVLDPNNPSFQNQDSDVLEIHLPPEATVKSRIHVHEVVTTKTHCVVSYAMHKTGKPSLKKKKKFLSNAEPLDNPLTMAAEICVSSEDEGGFTDRLSDVEDQTMTNNHPHNQLSAATDIIIQNPDNEPGSQEDELAVTTSENDIQDNADTSSGDILLTTSKDKGSTAFLAGENNGFNSAFEQELEICVENSDEDIFQAGDSADSNESISQNSVSTEQITNDISNEELNKCENENQHSVDRRILTSSSIDTSPKKQVPSKDDDVHMDEYSAENLTSPSQISQSVLNFNSSPQPELYRNASVVDLETKDSDKFEKPSDRIMHVLKKSWNSDNVGEITLAEVYLMLGKPGNFKLCYCWKKQEQKPNFDDNKANTDISNEKVSPGITALIKAAALLLTKLHKETPENSKQSSLHKEQCKTTAKKEKNSISVGVQCNISEKNHSAISTSSTVSVANAPHRRAHGRGTSKFSTPVTSSGSFVVPNVPPSRRRKIQDALPSRLTSSDPKQLQQGTQVRLGDVQFRKQMEALNRRIDLFRPQNKHRSMRKPFIVQRAMMPNAGAVRKMMTLSIDSSGANKVGFTPAVSEYSTNEIQSGVESVGATIPTSGTQKSIGPEQPSSHWNGSEQGFGEALGLKIQNQKNKTQNLPDAAQTPTSNQNLLKMAVDEAILSLGPSTAELGETISQKMDVDKTASCTSNVDSVKTTCSLLSEAPLLDTAHSTDSFQSDSAVIKNDVVLPVRPPTPSVDSILESFVGNEANIFEKGREFLAIAQAGQQVQEDTSAPSLSMPTLDLPGTPQKMSPVHPWSISSNSRDGLGSFATLNTPQRILPSDTEDSLDNSLYGLLKRPRVNLQGENSGAGLNSFFNDAETDLQMQCLMSENSVDFMAKFQELMQSDQEDKANYPPSSPALSLSKECNNQDIDNEKKGDG